MSTTVAWEWSKPNSNNIGVSTFEPHCLTGERSTAILALFVYSHGRRQPTNHDH